jgi:hypothetical protein
MSLLNKSLWQTIWQWVFLNYLFLYIWHIFIRGDCKAYYQYWLFYVTKCMIYCLPQQVLGHLFLLLSMMLVGEVTAAVSIYIKLFAQPELNRRTLAILRRVWFHASTLARWTMQEKERKLHNEKLQEFVRAAKRKNCRAKGVFIQVLLFDQPRILPSPCVARYTCVASRVANFLVLKNTWYWTLILHYKNCISLLDAMLFRISQKKPIISTYMFICQPSCCPHALSK